jgi:hypothetical protein
MLRLGCRRFLAVSLVLAGSVTAGAQTRPAGEPSSASTAPRPGSSIYWWGPGPSLYWWKNDDFKKELGLSEQQTAHIDRIFREARAQQEVRLAELSRLEQELSVQIKRNDPIEKVVLKVDQVEAKRSEMNKARTLMLYEMRRVMKGPQRRRFDELHAQWRKEQEQLRSEQSRKPGPKPEPRSDPRSR